MVSKFDKKQFSSLFEMEESLIDYWSKNKIFQKSLEKTKDMPPYSFYDGPPFITGMPHYATLLPSIAKDIIPRYQTMKGRYVRRVWGWDVHGLPAENQVEKQLGLKNRKDIETIGVDKFINACREYVKDGSEQWRWYIDHIGRWVELDNAYRTDSLNYMESTIWGFKQLYDNELIYQGNRVSFYCPRCATPLSKFEVTMDDDSYKEVQDPAITIALRLLGDDVFLLAWTTTPWTLTANVALAVNPDAEYVRVSDGQRQFILAHEALVRYRDLDLEILETFPGSQLVNQSYEPLFDFMVGNGISDFKIYPGDFVTTDEGTGIVHIAPGFGEDDIRLGQEFDLSIKVTVDEDGFFTQDNGKFAGNYYKKTDPLIIDDLTERKIIVKQETITHSYPHCYRCNTPLIYKAQTAWYLSIEPLKPELLANNSQITWVPKHFGSGRFAHNISTAPDWCISRTRYWGTPIPVWRTVDGSETIVIGSIEELEKMSGQKITDLHRPKIDEVVITTPSGKKAYRVKDVLDCWFESGMMPYAQYHYPFENQEEFEKSFPTDFIIEYTGQLRGWFYYLHVLGLTLKNSHAFNGVAVTGVLMGNDGRKMSKSFGNYPDPRITLEKYGAESLRLFFMNSKIMSGEDASVSEPEIREFSRLLSILHNSFSYFVTYANLHNFDLASAEEAKPELLDRWISVRLEELKYEVSVGLDNLNFNQAAKAIRPFIEDLSTWYIRRNRNRFVSGDQTALKTLHRTLKEFALTVAPIIPFSSELIYRTLTNEESVHLLSYPEVDTELAFNNEIIEKMAKIRHIVSTIHRVRAENNLSLRQPLARLTLDEKMKSIFDQEYLAILIDEINVKEIVFAEPEDTWLKSFDCSIYLETRLTDELIAEGRFRELVRKIQEARKTLGLKVGQKVTCYFQTDDKELLNVIDTFSNEITAQAFLDELISSDEGDFVTIADENIKIRFSEIKKDQQK